MTPVAPNPAHPRSVRLCRALLFTLGLLVLARGACAQERPIEFDIPAQPLAAALEAYNAATGKDVFYDGAAAVGQRSSALKGALAPDSALKALLEGTGLIVFPSSADAYTLIHAPRLAASETAALRMALDRPYAHYFAVIQATVQSTLCHARTSWRGPDQLLIRFHVGPSGAIERVDLTGSTGDPARDADLVATLQAVTFHEPPPRAMPQPVTMVVFPPQQAARAVCGRGEINRASR